MKKISLFFLFFSFFMSTQTGNSKNWEKSFSTAKEKAKIENKKILLVFSGSDWCAPCMKLEENIWNSPDFKSHAEKKYVLYKADFPRRKKNKLSEKVITENKLLFEKFNTNGAFPFVVLLEANEAVLGTTGYKKYTPLEYIQHLEGFKK